MSPPVPDWIIVDFNPLRLTCDRCGGFETWAEDTVPATVARDRIDRFAEAHGDCK